MTITKNKRQFSYLLIIISGLLLAVIITTTVVLVKKPMNHTDESFGDEPLGDISVLPSEVIISSPTSGNIETTSTFEAAAAHATDKNQESNTENNSNQENQEACKNPRIRKSWTELSNDEQSRFINAVVQMKSRPAHTNSAPNRYDEFAVIHDVYKSFAHNISAFLPWHRHFINEFERELQSIDSSVTLPYWDWASDAANGANSAVVQAFGGDGDPQTGCITNGPFANWQASYPGQHCLQRRFNGGLNIIQRWSSPAQVAALVFRFTDYTQFRSAFESTPHAAVHNGIGGDMRQTYSPNDPLFWVHHANVDRYFLAWQMENPRSTYNGGSLNDMMIPFNIPVSAAFNLPTNSRYCYTYSMGSDSMRNLLRKRTSGATKPLECPAHIPDEYTLAMGCSLEHVRMTEEYICGFTRRLNEKRSLPIGMKLSIPEEKSSTSKKNKIWRFDSGKERELILDSLE